MARAPLGRGARGLPRYYMDVGWYRHPTFAGLPIASLFVFDACVGYSTEHGTDGRVPADPEDLAAALGLRASDVRKALAPLVDRGVLVEDVGLLVVDGWAEHNPTAEEVKAHSDERRRAGMKGNHTKYHVNKGIVDPDCEWCTPRKSDRNSDRDSDPTATANGSHGIGWESSSKSESDGATAATDEMTDDDLIQSHIEAHYRWKLLDENPIRSLDRFGAWARPRMRQAIDEARLSGQDPRAALEMNWPTRAEGDDFDPGSWHDPDVPLYLRKGA